MATSPYQHYNMAHLERLLQRSLSGDSTQSSSGSDYREEGLPPLPRHSLATNPNTFHRDSAMLPATASLPLPLVAESGPLAELACCLSVPEDALQALASSYAPDTAEAMCEDSCCSWEPQQPGAAAAWRRQQCASSCQAVRSGSSGSHHSSSSGGSSHAQNLHQQQEDVRAMAAAKLRAMRAVQEQLRSAEHRLQHELVTDGSKPSSPTGAARRPAASPQQKQQLRQRMSTAGPSNVSSRHHHAPQHTGSPAGLPAAARLSRHSSGGSSTAAALLAANADPALVGEYLRFHRLQHQQHQACIAAVAATANTSQQHKGGMSPAAAAKLRQVMALQQQQIQAQQELLAMLA